MKILALCKRFYTNKDLLLDRFGRLYHLPVQLEKLGCSVVVIALDYRSNEELGATHDGVEFRSVPMRFGSIFRTWSRLVTATDQFRPHVILASGDSHIGYMASRLARRVNARFAFDVYDYYPAFRGNRIPGMGWMFREAVRRADLVICASNPLVQRLSQSSTRVVLAENGVDRSIFRPIDKRVARSQLGIPPDVPVVGYFGSLTPEQGPILFEAAQILRQRLPQIRLLVAGHSSVRLSTDSFVSYLGALPQEHLPILMAASDVLAIPYAPGAQINVAAPCKVAEYIACERPVVATDVSDHADQFPNTPQSICSPSAQSLANAIIAQLDHPQIEPFPPRFDWADIGARLHKELSQI